MAGRRRLAARPAHLHRVAGCAGVRSSVPGRRRATNSPTTAASAAAANARTTPPEIGPLPRGRGGDRGAPHAHAKRRAQHVGQAERGRRPTLTAGRSCPQHHEGNGRVAQAHAQAGQRPGDVGLPEGNTVAQLPGHPGGPDEDQSEADPDQASALPLVVEPRLDPRSQGPGQGGGGHDAPSSDGAVMAHRRDGQGHIGVCTEEGEREQPAAEHGGRQTGPCPQGACREETP